LTESGEGGGTASLGRSASGSVEHVALGGCSDPDGTPDKLVVVAYTSSDGTHGMCTSGGTPYQDMTVIDGHKTGLFMVLMGQLLPQISLSGENGLKDLHRFGVPRHVAVRIMAEFNSLRAPGKSLEAIELEMPKWALAHSSLFHLTPV
jgi:hypothetical protein